MSGEDRKPGSSKSSAARICPSAASATQTARPFASIVFSPDGSGTIWTERGFGAAPGLLMRRGSLIGPSVEAMLPTFADSGSHELVILRIMSRYLAETLGPLAPRAVNGPVHKYAGDLATIGKGELLLTA